MIPTSRTAGTDGARTPTTAHGNSATRKLRLRRGLRPRIRRASLHLQRGGLLRALRAGGAEARLRRRPPRRGGARRPRQPRRQRRDPRPRLRAGRARQRLLAGAGRTGRALAGALAAPPGVPRRVARPARQGGRARRQLRRADRQLRLRAARRRDGDPRAAASRSSWRPSPPGAGSPTAANGPVGLDRRCARLGDRLGAVLADEQLGLERAAARRGRGSAGARSR